MLKGKVLDVQGDLFEEFDKGTFNVLLNLMNREGKYYGGVSRVIGKRYPGIVNFDARVWPNTVASRGGDIDEAKKGKSFAHAVDDGRGAGKYVINLYAIKKNPDENGSTVSLKQLRSALEDMLAESNRAFSDEENGFKPIYGFPAMGTGLAGGNWDEISDVLSEVLLKENRGVYIYQ